MSLSKHVPDDGVNNLGRLPHEQGHKLQAKPVSLHSSKSQTQGRFEQPFEYDFFQISVFVQNVSDNPRSAFQIMFVYV